MNLNIKTLLGATALAAAALLPQAALADSLTFTLNNSVQSVTTAGGTLTFSGTITAPTTNTATEYLNGYSFDLLLDNQYYSLDDSPFFNGAYGLGPGDSYTEALFTLTLNAGLPKGTYTGSFTLQGGATDNVYDTLGSGSLQVNVADPVSASAPEPSSLVLLGTGILGAVSAARRRLKN